MGYTTYNYIPQAEVDTEAIPVSTSSYFFYQTEIQTYNNENSNIVGTYAKTPKTTTSNIRSTFTCTNLIQTIKINKRCDKHLDCEDGTDEEDCTCRDYLLNFHPTAICGGHLDCDDETDEKYCGMCNNNKFRCSRSGGCIPMTERCDGNFDCSLREDELDCIALTNGEYVNVDSDNWSALNTEGLLNRYYNDTWHQQRRFACGPRNGNYTYLWPWLAAIFVDGRYHCSALLLESDWLLSSSSCTENIRLSVNYTTALLGQSRSFLYVDGPHQQISVVDEIRDVKRTNVSLLHLKTAVNHTRYVQPLFLEKKIYPPAKDDLCVAIGTDNERVTRSNNGTSSNWSGTVFCRSKKGWYLVAAFQEKDGPCSFRSTRNLISIDYIHAYLTQALEEVSESTPEAACDGVRCNHGQCISWNQVCDGVMDCRDGADEKNGMCLQMQQIRRRNETNNKCAKSEIRCRNGECISKSAFCDGKVDCSNGADEPVICSCAEYLKLTTPERLCDGVRHCLDKTDESPEECQCTNASFKCNRESKNFTCISQDFVCDGDNDCPNGEDETDCTRIQQLTDRSAAGKVMQRSYGVWHTLCYPSEVTSQEEAVNVCKNSGYMNGIIDYKYQSLNQAVVPSRDDFYMIRLNSDTWITMRDDKPLITLVRPEKPCYRLFIKCSN
ncbi:PREDICTED: serine protease nudel-like [Cyphomyrmex costatus]|uniref:serine protease nudel-like n=1 Tax=Cyphomyrmex costatus TaxID=456900 RepID=UPI000852299D|nr:PREDICTED: serine protease nudel-like [Cyphomyrmex costatus]